MSRSTVSESTRYMPLGVAVLPSFGLAVDAHAIEWNKQPGRWRD